FFQNKPDNEMSRRLVGSEMFISDREELARFSRQILAGTEDVWTKLFADMGKKYEAPTLVFFTDAVQSGCGNASASMGPFYCSADESLYIDLSFFRDMRKTLGADGDFAYAYVIAHEVGHHVQHLLGTLDKAHSAMSRMDNTDANNMSVRIELQADFLAGVWAHHDNQMFGSLEEGDIEEALDAAQKIGDDYLQRKAQGYSVPDSFTHGTSEQRERWLKRGLSTGNINMGDTFSIPYEDL
ncbi:MAG: neutral zinc metallopeptidase, partial [Duncaniella sp.]|nr:neutral zinc metallopeptidase [Duncaniella sp.]